MDTNTNNEETEVKQSNQEPEVPEGPELAPDGSIRNYRPATDEQIC